MPQKESKVGGSAKSWKHSKRHFRKMSLSIEQATARTPPRQPYSPALFFSPHKALVKLPFLPAHTAHCSKQTFWHLTEFHFKPQKRKGFGSQGATSYSGKNPPSISLQLPLHMHSWGMYEASLPKRTSSFRGRLGHLPLSWGSRGPAQH